MKRWRTRSWRRVLKSWPRRALSVFAAFLAELALSPIQALLDELGRPGVHRKCDVCLDESRKKIKAIQALKRPTTVTEVRRLIGMVQYYRDLWPRRSHILQPFTAISSGKRV